MRNAIRFGAAALVALAAAALGVAPASAAVDPIAVVPTSAAAGTTVHVSGVACDGSEAFVNIVVEIGDWGESDGSIRPGQPWDFAIAVPADTAPGDYDVLAVCDNYDTSSPYPPATFTVTGSTNPPPTVTVTAPGTSGTPTVAAGSGLHLHGVGFDGGERVSAELHSDPVSLGTFTANASGVVDGIVTIPVATPPGIHQVTLTGASSGRTGSLTMSVSAALARTGANTSSLATAGMICLVAGVVLVLGGRRRRLRIAD